MGEGKTIADYPGRLNVNLPGHPVRRDWLHFNAMDYNSELDQVTFSAVYGEVYIVDHGGTFVPGDPDRSIAVAAGNMLLFNNGHYLFERMPPSYVQKINPCLDAGGNDTGSYLPLKIGARFSRNAVMPSM